MQMTDFCSEYQKMGYSVLFDEPMSRHTSFCIGGPADVFLTPSSEEEIGRARRLCFEMELPLTIMGNGSNLLVSDRGIRGVVMQLGRSLSDIRLLDETTLLCEAGAMLSSVCRFALDHGLSGLEFAWGIPGSVGGAAYMNAGAYGGEMKDVVLECRHLSAGGAPGCRAGALLQYGYRTSAYAGSGDCITAVLLRLTPGDPDRISLRMNELFSRRKEKQPLDLPSAGSVFKRPEGAYAAELIERCGLKGLRVGGAMVSTLHSGFIVNIDHATARDVRMLIEKVQDVVAQQTGYRLECEIKMIGQEENGWKS